MCEQSVNSHVGTLNPKVGFLGFIALMLVFCAQCPPILSLFSTQSDKLPRQLESGKMPLYLRKSHHKLKNDYVQP